MYVQLALNLCLTIGKLLSTLRHTAAVQHMECILSRVAVWHAATMLLLTFCALFSSEMVSPKLGIWHRLSIWTSLEIRNKCNDCALLTPCAPMNYAFVWHCSWSSILFLHTALRAAQEFEPWVRRVRNPCNDFACACQCRSLVCISCHKLCGSPLFHKSLDL